MSADARTCPSCGAHVSAAADRCDLCGTSVEASSDAPDESDDTAPPAPDSSREADEGSAPDEASGEEGEDAPTVFCNQCGWENPPGARYCSRCGEELQDLSAMSTPPAGTRRVSADLPTGTASGDSEDSGGDSPPSSSSSDDAPSEDEAADEQAAMGRQIALLVGGALTIVLGLFLLTQWSAQYDWNSESASEAPSAQAGGNGSGPASASGGGGQQPRSTSGQGGDRAAPMDLRSLLDQTADSLTGAVAGQIDSLRTRIEQASGAEKQELQSELVNLFIGAGHPDRAAVVQKDLAEATGAVDAQRRAADLLYRWMQKVQGQGQREQIFQVARHAAQAYEAVVERRPDDLDARTRMGETYLLTNEPMQGIKAINAVLDDDSTFVPARFQKGLALLQINRLDQATRQFEMVQKYAEEGSPFARQAERAIDVIEKRRSRTSSGGSAPPSGTDQ